MSPLPDLSQPLKIEITEAEILADLLYPAGIELPGGAANHDAVPRA